MTQVFLSYRRADCPGHAGWLFERLKAAFGQQNVFMDVDGIGPGEDFVQVIERRITSADLVIVLIGAQWMGEGTPPRIWRDDDYVRNEVAVSLRRDARVVPVLVQGAVLPKAQDLPEDLRGLPSRNAVRINDESFVADADRMIGRLRTQNAKRNHRDKGIRYWVSSAVLVVAAIFASKVLIQQQGQERSSQDQGQSALSSLGSGGATLDSEPANAATLTGTSGEKKVDGATLQTTATPDPRVRHSPTRPRNDFERFGRFCLFSPGDSVYDWQQGIRYEWFENDCFVSMEACLETSNLIKIRDNMSKGMDCREMTPLWCYYAWGWYPQTSDRSSPPPSSCASKPCKELVGPVFCSAYPKTCDRVRQRDIQNEPKHRSAYGRLTYSDRCYLVTF